MRPSGRTAPRTGLSRGVFFLLGRTLCFVCCLSCALVCALGTVECWGGRQGGCGPELCVRRLRVCGSQLAVCLVSLFVSVCRSCVSSSSVQRPPIPRWCPVRAWLFFTFLPTYLPLNGYRNGVPGRAISRRPNCASVRSPHTPCCPRVVLVLYWAHTEAVGSHHVPFKFSATELWSALCTSSWDAVSSFDPRRSSHVGAPVRSAVIAVARY